MNAQDLTALDPTGPPVAPAPAEGEDISAWQMVGGALTMLAFGVYAFIQLSRLERGDADMVRVWAPAAGIYNLIGFWPAVSILPTISLYMAWLAVRRMWEQSASGGLSA